MAAGPSTSDVLNFASINFLASDECLDRLFPSSDASIAHEIVLMLLVRPARENGEIGGIAYNASATERRRSSATNAIAGRRTCRRLMLRPFQQFRQLGNVERDPASFISGR